MTLPRFGNIVPIQGDMLELIGYHLSRGHVGLDIPDEERMRNMRQGLSSLRRQTKRDFGFDLVAWHEFLLANPDFGYNHPYAFAGIRRAVEEAINDPERERLVNLLKPPGATD